jgi:hypothetical protein
VLISFSDHELAALRTAATPLSPEQRDRFLAIVARVLGCCPVIKPDTVAQVASMVTTAMVTTTSQAPGMIATTMLLPSTRPTIRPAANPPAGATVGIAR